METNVGIRSIPLGKIVVTRGANDRLHPVDVYVSLQRHAQGDWGELEPEDEEENECSLREGFRLLSAYQDRNGTKFWIITLGDRSVTTILLPEEY
jgi:hypothetical protein